LRAHLCPTGDARAVAYLRGLGARLKAAPAQDSRSIGLLRDLYAATGNADFLGQASGLIEGLEKLARSRPPSAEEGPGFGWDDFCAYVFGAAEPLAPPRSDGTPAK
jgi:hypothetical protein